MLTYFNGGYTQAHFESTNFINTTVLAAPLATGVVSGSRTRDGWFIGGGTEYAVSQLPGLFWKNEVRFSDLGNETNTFVCTAADRLRRWRRLEPDQPCLLAEGDHRAGLPLQLGWPGRREVLISPELTNSKAPAFAGAFLCLAHGELDLRNRRPCPLPSPRKHRTLAAARHPAATSEQDRCANGFRSSVSSQLAIGLLWIGQGTGVIAWPASSFMISQTQWAWYGAALAALGADPDLAGPALD